MGTLDDSLPTDAFALADLRVTDLVGGAETASIGPGSRLGEYTVRSVLGQGGMGIVYLAEQETPRRWVALKIVRPALAASEVVLERFLREVRIVGSFQHENVVRLLGAGRVDGVPYCAMEYVQGQPLARLIGPGGLEVGARRDPRDAARIARDVARGLAYAHARGVLHRDVKPGNVLVSLDDRRVPAAKVVDFGLALPAGESRLTVSGQVLGTPLYMAPEQLAGRVDSIGESTDVYGLGATLYEMLTGRVPYPGDSPASIAALQGAGPPAPPRRIAGDVPRALQNVCLRMLALEPGRRYPSAAEAADDLDRFLEGEPVLATAPAIADRVGRFLSRHRVACLFGAIAAILAGALAATLNRPGEEVAAPIDRRPEALALVEEARLEFERSERSPDGPPPGCRERVEAALALCPDLTDGRHLRGRLRHEAGDLEGAEADWRAVLAADPDHEPASYRLGRLLVERAYLATLRIEDDAPRATSSEAIGLLERASGSGNQAELARAFLAWHREEDDEVRRICAAALDRDPEAAGSETFQWLLAHVPGEDALERLGRAIARAPRYPIARFCRANALRRASRDPATPAERRDWAARSALDDYAAAVRSWPAFFEAWLNLGALRMDAGDPAGAIEAMRRAVAIRPASFHARYNLASFLAGAGDAGGAIAEYDAALGLRPGDLAVLVRRGLLRHDRKEYEAAIRDFTAALEVEPRCVAALVDRALSRLASGDPERAAADAERAVALAPAGSTERGKAQNVLRRCREALGGR